MDIKFLGNTPPAMAFLGHPSRHLFFTGKGGVGKTSLSTATALALADAGKKVLLVSTDAASNLDEMLGIELRNTPTPVPGAPGLSVLNIDPEAAAESYRQRVLAQMQATSTEAERATVREQLSGSCTTEIASFDEFSSLLAGDAAAFDHIVFDTAPTGHTLRLLSLPDFLDASIGKIVRLRQKLTSATDAVKGIFGVGEDKQDDAVEKLEQLKAQVKEVRTLFRNKDTTEFIIVTIPTVLGVSESGRLLQSLRDEDVPCKRLIVNQVLKVNVDDYKSAAAEARDAQDALESQLSGADAEAMKNFTELNAKALKAAQAAVNFCSIKEKDQARALQMCEDDAGLKTLNRTDAPLFDMEIRGVPALKFFGDQVWR